LRLTTTQPSAKDGAPQETDIMADFINLTPHAITIRPLNGDEIVIPASGQVARVTTRNGLSDLSGHLPVPAQVVTYGDITGLPPFEAYGPSVFYIVSGMVMSALREQDDIREDVIAPGTGPSDGAIRDERGHVVAVTTFTALV